MGSFKDFQPKGAQMSDLSHLTDYLSNEPQEIPLDVLSKLVTRFRKDQERVAKAESELKEAREAFNQVSQVDIPQFLLQFGVAGVPLSTGEMLRVDQKVSASVKDIDDFAEFLTARGDDDILKTTFALGKLPIEVVRKIQKLLIDNFDLSPDIARSVHSATLKKYVKELCGIGMENPEERLGERYIPLQELPESVSVYTYFETTIKKK